jgi:UDP-3-O-[3-hydroxymyristoyl] N-acetylglucosamine deacetylase
MQRTIKREIEINGVGLHSGLPICMRLLPAPANHGIMFQRTDIQGRQGKIPALWDRVIDTMMCTKIANEHDVCVGTIEHIMAALYACEITNLLIQVNAPEIPVMDGSSQEFVKAIDEAGTQAQHASHLTIEVLKTVRFEADGNRWAELRPWDSFAIKCHFNFDHYGEKVQLAPQTFSYDGTPATFKKDIMSARTFGAMQDVEQLWASGLARGGSLDNAVVIDGARIVNHEGFRFPDECVRHKVLDAVGDLYTAGAHIKGYFESSQPGHGMQNQLLRALFSDPSAWRRSHSEISAVEQTRHQAL